MATSAEALDRLIEAVERVTAQPAAPGDAIDAALARPARQTAVESLGDSPVMAKFRGELSDGLVRIDTLNQVLRLITLAVERWRAA